MLVAQVALSASAPDAWFDSIADQLREITLQTDQLEQLSQHDWDVFPQQKSNAEPMP